MRIDPVYAAILEPGFLPSSGRIADLGCGQGITLAVISTAARLYESGDLPGGMEPPRDVELLGFDVREKQVAIAQRALGNDARIQVADLRTLRIPQCRAIVLFDSLHYMADGDQQLVLNNVASALEPGGTLLIREADAGGGKGFAAVRYSEMLRAFGRGDWRQEFFFRTAGEWAERVERLGFEVRTEDMSGRTPFRNVLLRGVRLSS
jgi:SAM-dependent methyltransferase